MVLQGPCVSSCHASGKRLRVAVVLVQGESTGARAQAVMGTVVKRHLAARLGHDPASIYHVAIMPCYDKKLEASRDDFNLPGAPRGGLLRSHAFLTLAASTQAWQGQQVLSVCENALTVAESQAVPLLVCSIGSPLLVSLVNPAAPTSQATCAVRLLPLLQRRHGSAEAGCAADNQ